MDGTINIDTAFIHYFIAISGVLIIVIYLSILFIKVTSSNLYEIKNNIKSIANGNLKNKIFYRSFDEIGDISYNINIMQNSILKIIEKITSESDYVNNIVDKTEEHTKYISTEAKKILDSTNILVGDMKKTENSMSNINNNTKQIYNLIKDTLFYINETKKLTNNIFEKSVVLKSNSIAAKNVLLKSYKVADENLQDSIEKSRDITKVKELSRDILSIMSKIKLLSINATLEAAKAGEAGKGFSVVASEIQKLSNNSNKIIKKINVLNNEIVKSVKGLLFYTEELMNFIKSRIFEDYENIVLTSEEHSKNINCINNIIIEFNNKLVNLDLLVNNISECVDDNKTSYHSVNELKDISRKSDITTGELNLLVKYINST